MQYLSVLSESGGWLLELAWAGLIFLKHRCFIYLLLAPCIPTPVLGSEPRALHVLGKCFPPNLLKKGVKEKMQILENTILETFVLTISLAEALNGQYLGRGRQFKKALWLVLLVSQV